MGKDIYDVKTYAGFAKKSISWKYLEKPTIVKLLKDKVDGKQKIIEAGCGEGRLIELLIGLGAKEENISGIDLSSYLLAIGREKFPKANWFCGSIGGLFEGIKEDGADLVISSMVLDYLNNKSYQQFLKNCGNWLKRGGNLILLFPHPIRMAIDSLDKYFKRAEGKNITPWGEWVPYYHRTIGDYVNEIIKAGFEIKEFIEPELPEAAAKEGKKVYKKYTRCPMRLAILAVKK